MSDHYYTSRPEAAHDERRFQATLRGMEFSFTTDAAVFSRERVDFGTLLLIETMEIPEDAVVLDLGCGYGPVGTVAARMVGQGKVYLVDVNQRAASLARRNLADNGIENAEVREGDGCAPVEGIPFDVVVMNPPIRAGKCVVYRLVDEAHEVLKPGGVLWVVIQTKQGAPSMKRQLKAVFGNVTDAARQAGYHVFRSIKEG